MSVHAPYLAIQSVVVVTVSEGHNDPLRGARRTPA